MLLYAAMLQRSFVHLSRAVKTKQSGRTDSLNVKAFQATSSGTGWCVDAHGHKSKVKNLIKVGCWGAKNACENDDTCVAFACASLRGLSVLYTPENCDADCDILARVKDPSLIVRRFRYQVSGEELFSIEGFISLAFLVVVGFWLMASVFWILVAFMGSGFWPLVAFGIWWLLAFGGLLLLVAFGFW